MRYVFPMSDKTLVANVTLLKSGLQMQKCLLRNLAAYRNSVDVGSLSYLGKGRPAIVVGCGPSLLDSAAELAQTEIPIFAPVQACKALEGIGARPAIYGIADPWVDVCPMEDTIPLLATMTSHYGMVSRWRGPRYMLPTDELTARYLRASKWGILASVTTLLFELADFMRCNPIYLVGVDLAQVGDLHHAPGTDGNNQERVWGVTRNWLERRIHDRNGKTFTTSPIPMRGAKRVSSISGKGWTPDWPIDEVDWKPREEPPGLYYATATMEALFGAEIKRLGWSLESDAAWEMWSQFDTDHEALFSEPAGEK